MINFFQTNTLWYLYTTLNKDSLIPLLENFENILFDRRMQTFSITKLFALIKWKICIDPSCLSEIKEERSSHPRSMFSPVFESCCFLHFIYTIDSFFFTGIYVKAFKICAKRFTYISNSVCSFFFSSIFFYYYYIFRGKSIMIFFCIILGRCCVLYIYYTYAHWRYMRDKVACLKGRLAVTKNIFQFSFDLR